jgi:DNA invertase Pin-like site-specific DNA recombinase
MDTYCTAPECEAPSREGRIYCEFHNKRHQRGQSLTAPKAERLTANGRLVEVALRFAHAETDEEYSKAHRDLLRTAKQTGPSLHGELVRQGMAAAKKRGVKIGPPFQTDPVQVREAVTREGSIAAAARALRISRPTVYRALARVAQAPVALQQAA